MPRFLPLLVALSLAGAASAQTVSTSAAQQVQLLAPQLVAFSGSSPNFESLVNGLTQGLPVTLTTVGADGLMQIVTFLPGTTLNAPEAARALETARQSLITQGIATPSAQQLAIALMGGVLPTAVGSTPVSGVLTGSTTGAAIQVRNEVALSPAASSSALSTANLQALRTALVQGTSATLTGAGGSVTFAVPGARTALEANQAIQLATTLLAQQGIIDPTPEQLRVALLGGSLTTAAGTVPVQGVLQGQVVSTSRSPYFGTSNSPLLGTSNTPPAANPVTTPAAAAGATGGLGSAAGARPAPFGVRR